jgi:hypothetical protein
MPLSGLLSSCGHRRGGRLPAKRSSVGTGAESVDLPSHRERRARRHCRAQRIDLSARRLGRRHLEPGRRLPVCLSGAHGRRSDREAGLDHVQHEPEGQGRRHDSGRSESRVAQRGPRPLSKQRPRSDYQKLDSLKKVARATPAASGASDSVDLTRQLANQISCGLNRHPLTVSDWAPGSVPSLACWCSRGRSSGGGEEDRRLLSQLVLPPGRSPETHDE